MAPAKAADLGGDCCADLEERVAELEATTARKGNRKMSLTVTGQVHRMNLFWDDGQGSGQYYGIDNTNSSSRFAFIGNAKVTPSVTVGFDITIEIEAGGTSSKLSQFDEDGKVGTQINGTGAASFNASNVDSYFGDARRANVFIEHKDLGRVTMGRQESAGAITTIDLAGIGTGASGSVVLVNGSFLLRGPAGQYYAMNWAALGDPAANQGRTEALRYDSPTIAGFIVSGSVAEAGDYWGVMLRYAGEFSGVRIAAGIGYENVKDRATSASPAAGPNDILIGAKPDVEAWGAGLSLLHVPTGLFVQGHYMKAEFSGGASGYWGQAVGFPAADKSDATQWLIQAGISKNWFGIGNTAIFAEYSKNEDWGSQMGAGRTYSNATVPGAVTVTGVTATDMRVWGVGITQQLDAAATTLYLNYRNFEADVSCAAACAPGQGTSLATENFHAIITGAVVRF